MVRSITASIVAIWSLASAAEAGSIVLRNGRVIQAQEYRVEGDAYVVTMPSGRVMRIPRQKVDEAATASPEPAAPPPPPATAPPAGEHQVYTNEDLPGGGALEGGARGGSQRKQELQAQSYERSKAAEEKTWDSWRRRYERVQARIDGAQAKLSELEARSDAVNGDVETTSDGSKITGMRPGSGWNASYAHAQNELKNAEAALEALREEADRAGVPPGVMR